MINVARALKENILKIWDYGISGFWNRKHQNFSVRILFNFSVDLSIRFE
jgi:hypothetical protein